jgi:glutathione S-transferase
MTDDKYTLYYFNFTGRAEAIRCIFHMAGAEFNDVRLTGEEFGAKKQSNYFPLSYVPMLEKGDFKLNGTCAIYQYLGRKYNVWPENAEEDSKALSICMAMEDVRSLLVTAHFTKDEEAKKVAFGKAVEGYQKFEGNLFRFKGEHQFITGDKFNAVDFVMFEFFHQFVVPNIKNVASEAALNFYDKCSKEETVAEYLKKQQK